MKVTIKETCARCKRSTEKEIDSSQLPQIEAAEKKRAEQLSNVTAMLKEQDSATMPDLLVWYRGKIQHIDKICEARCHKTITSNLDSVFRQIDPSKRKPRVKKPNISEEKKEADPTAA